MAIATELKKTVEETGKALLGSKPVHVAAGVGDLAVEMFRTATGSAQGLLSGARVGQNLAELPGRAQSAVTDAVVTAANTYDDLAGRGSDVIKRIGRQQATQDMKAAAATTTSKAKATTTTARKAARTTVRQVRTTATTAKTSSASARSNAKATATSAKKTASAATRATKAAASKIG